MKRRVLLTVLGVCLVLGFSALGRWQLGREQIKREQLAAAAAALSGPAVALDDVLTQGEGITRVEGRAEFLDTPRLLLDNQRRGQRVGMRLYCAARAARAASGPPLLVDMGWLPVGGDRVLPTADCPRGEQSIAGLLVPPPSVGLRLGPGLVAQGDDWLATRVEPPAVSAAWSLDTALAPRVLRLDPALPLGHERDLELHANTLPPEKHRGYAFQWFGLAAATVVILLLLNLRRRP